MHSDFTLFLRTYPNGKKVYFYYTYDEKGKRKGPWTTNSQNKTAARNYCHTLIKDGKLLHNSRTAMTFGEFAKGFWDEGSDYLEYRSQRSDLTTSYIVSTRSITDTQLIPFFGGVRLDKITTADVNNWLLGFCKRESKKKGKKYKNGYANSSLRALSVMMTEAVRLELIPNNPCSKVKPLKENQQDIQIITVEEVQRLFPENYKTVWGRKEIAYAANKLAALTGMRSAEILGLRGEFVYDDYIYVCGQYGSFGYLPHTKNKKNRNIPLMPEMIQILRKLMEKNGNGFVFSHNGGAKPITHNNLYKGLKEALEKIGIDENERKRRGLTLHSWRHFLNTKLIQQGLTLEQVQSVTGHLSKKMTDRYNHPDARQLDAVIKAQTVIAGADEPKDGKPDEDNVMGLKIVKMPDRTAEQVRKGA